MKDTYYIKLDTNAGEDPKVKILRKYYNNMEAFGEYIFLILKLRSESTCKLEYSDLTFVFERKPVLKKCNVLAFLARITCGLVPPLTYR